MFWKHLLPGIKVCLSRYCLWRPNTLVSRKGCGRWWLTEQEIWCCIFGVLKYTTLWSTTLCCFDHSWPLQTNYRPLTPLLAYFWIKWQIKFLLDSCQNMTFVPKIIYSDFAISKVPFHNYATCFDSAVYFIFRVWPLYSPTPLFLGFSNSSLLCQFRTNVNYLCWGLQTERYQL